MELSYEQIETLRDLSTIDDKKDYLQKSIGLYNWLGNQKSYFEWFTGTGKTRMLCTIIKHCEDRMGKDWISYVIVPNKVLKDQFLETIEFMGIKNAQVFIINSYIKHPKKKCHLLVADEIHLMSNDKSQFFSTVIPKTEFHVFAGGSATLENKHKEYFRRLGITCCSKFTSMDSESVGLCPPYTIYNVPVQLTDEEKKKYQEITNRYWEHYNYFQSITGTDTYNAINYILKERSKFVKWPAIVVNGKWKLKWFDIDPSENDKINWNRVGVTGEYIAERVAQTKTELEGWKCEKGYVINRAIQWQKTVNERRKVLNFSENLDKVSVEILKRIDERVLIFCEYISSCKYIAEHIGASEFHSKIPEKIRNRNLEAFKNDEIKYLASCKGLIAGMDNEDIRILFRHSYTGKQLSANQGKGRVSRISEKNKLTKRSVIINTYVDDFYVGETLIKSQQKVWLTNSYKGDPNVIWIQSLDEIEI